MERLAEAAGTMPRFRTYVGSGIGRSIGLLIGIVLMFFAGSIFSTLGGLLGAALFVKRQPQMPPPSQP
jgi:tetrahydromethanopterin S-methyltransferase subunit G